MTEQDGLTLGIGGFDHDGAVALIADDQIIGHLEWERVCRRRFAGLREPAQVAALLAESGWPLDEVSAIAWADQERFTDPTLLPVRAWLAARFPRAPLTVIDHHRCHLASAYYCAGLSRAAVLSIDGKGDGASAALASGEDDALRVVVRQPSASSLGRAWHALAITCGYPHFGAAGKVMALAAHGVPRHLDALLGWTELREDGTFTFTAPGEEVGTGPTFRRADRKAAYFAAAFAVPSVSPEALPQGPHADLAASIQAWTERVVEHLATVAVQRANSRRLCMAGGVALNIMSNSYLLDRGIIDALFVQPAAGDSGLALGAGLALRGRRIAAGPAGRFSPYQGRACAPAEVAQALRRFPGLRAREQDVVQRAAECLMQGELVGWFHGRAEAGPRALGARSLLASPLHAGQRARVNQRKRRESFRPVALMVTEAWYRRAFVGPACPYMLRCARVRPAYRALLGEGLHQDDTARLQIVDEASPPLLARLLAQLVALGGVPALLNTSLNAKGEPLVNAPADALQLLVDGQIDRLFIEGFEVERSACTA